MVVQKSVGNLNSPALRGNRLARSVSEIRDAQDSDLFAKMVAGHVSNRSTAEFDIDERAMFEALRICAQKAGLRCSGEKGTKGLGERVWYRRWTTIRNHLVTENQGLVYSMLHRIKVRIGDRDDLVSEASLALVRAVEGFDPSRGFQFSTYACNAIVRAFIYVNKKTQKYNQRFSTEHEDWLEPMVRTDRRLTMRMDRVSQSLRKNGDNLTAREAAVLDWRFPMDGGNGRTLGEIGAFMGLSKERIRQIQQAALAKLRQTLSVDPLMH